jgi:hypothetical protein
LSDSLLWLNKVELVKVLEEKWLQYRHLFYIWLVLHICTVGLVMAYAVVKSQLNVVQREEAHGWKDAYVLAFSVVFFLLVLVTTGWMVFMLVRHEEPLLLTQPHSNGLFIVLYFVFNISIAVDCVW